MCKYPVEIVPLFFEGEKAKFFVYKGKMCSVKCSTYDHCKTIYSKSYGMKEVGKDIEEISLAIIVALGIHFLLVCLLFIHLTHSGTKKSKKHNFISIESPQSYFLSPIF